MAKHAPHVYFIAVGFSVVVTCVDLFADNGEISPAVVLLLLVIAGGIVGAIHSHFSLALAVLTAIGLPATHLTLHLLGYKTTLQPDTVASILMVGVVSLCAASIGVLIGAAVRRTVTRTRHSDQ